jgi:hypothetical protein
MPKCINAVRKNSKLVVEEDLLRKITRTEWYHGNIMVS